MHPSIMKSQEQSILFKRLSFEINIKLLNILKGHKDTKKIEPNNPEYGFNEVIDHVIKETSMKEIKSVGIYFTTTKAIKTLNKFLNDEIKKEFSKEKEINTQLAIVLTNQLNSYLGAHGFFSTITKDVFVVKDAHLQRPKKEKKIENKEEKPEPKETKSKETWKKEFGYKPSRINHKEWLRIHNRATLAHELFHYCMDLRSKTADVLLQEEYAYSNMIGWYRKEGLKDPEIIKASLIWWGRTLSLHKDPSLRLKNRKKDWEKETVVEAKKLIASYDAACKTKQESSKYAEERRKDIEDGIFLELI